MRITNTTIARNYTSNLNRNLVLLNDANYRVSSQRKFNTMQENTPDGVRAMNVRRSIARIDGYLDNAKTTKNTFSSAETNLMKISDINKEISDKYIKAINGDNGKDERGIIATELEKLRDEILSLANGQYSDRYLFGGTNTKTQPFTTEKPVIYYPADYVAPPGGTAVAGDPINPGDDDYNTYYDPQIHLDELFYNGVKVDSTMDPKGDHKYLFDDAAFVDLGLGFTMQQTPDQQLVEPNSAFKNTLVGLDFLGTGEDNIYNVVNELILSLRGGNFDAAEGGKLLDKLHASTDNVNVQLTKIGADTAYLEFTVERLESQTDDLIEQQDHLEFVDPYEAIMDFKMQEYVYNAALQMGSRLLQPSIFNFIN